MDGHRPVRNIGQGVGLPQKGLVHGREDPARKHHRRGRRRGPHQGDVRLSQDEGALHPDVAIDFHVPDLLRQERKPVDAHQRRNVRPDPVHQAGVRVVRHRPEHREDQRAVLGEPPVGLHAPADDGRHHLPAHLNMVAVRKFRPGRVQPDASVGRQTPHGRRQGGSRKKQKEKKKSESFHGQRGLVG